jgi:hypothetical protein
MAAAVGHTSGAGRDILLLCTRDAAAMWDADVGVGEVE